MAVQTAAFLSALKFPFDIFSRRRAAFFDACAWRAFRRSGRTTGRSGLRPRMAPICLVAQQ